MRKTISLILALLLVAAIVFIFTLPVLADTGDAPQSQGFFTWAVLATYAGALAVTMAVTQLLKGVGFISKIPTRIFSWIIAALILIAATFFMGDLTLESAALCLINAVVVSLAANGGHDLISAKLHI